MTKLFNFGCSWSAGVGKVYYNWAREFAIQNPDTIVDNFALGGTSVKWSVTQMLANQPRMINADIVFQITAPGRVTLTDNGITSLLARSRVVDNYYDSSTTPHNHMLTLKPAERSCHRTIPAYSEAEVTNIHDAIYNSFDPDVENLEWKLYIDYVVDNATFVFFHQTRHQKLYQKLGGELLPCVQTHFGDDQFDEWVYDDGAHFGLEGCKEVARWIKTNLNK